MSKLIDILAKTANRTDRFLGTLRNNVVKVTTRGPEVIPPMLRAAKHKVMAASYLTRLSLTKPGTPAAIKLAESGIQLGAVTGMITTKVWLISELRKELKDADVFMRDVDTITSFTGTAADTGTGIDQLRLDEADIEYPIYLTRDGIIVDGNHRLLKAKMSGKKSVPVQYVTPAHLEILNCDLPSAK